MVKPDLTENFNKMPLIGIYLKYDYENANTIEQLTNLVHKWLGISETTKNEVKKYFYQISAKRLYSILTKKSYESKHF